MRSWVVFATILFVFEGCGGDEPEAEPREQVTSFTYAVPLDPASPWPKFRRTESQTGWSPVLPIDDGSEPWVFQTGKGIFSTPVIGGDGTVYIGSADRFFYAIDAGGTERWKLLTGEIIDSSALLDDQGRVYFGSGDGTLYALDRTGGSVVWTFAADDPSVNGAYINWFEGNVAIATDGTLYAPNDNFCTYAVERDTGARKWCFRTYDQTWSLPAVNPSTGTLFLGNNFFVFENLFAVDPLTGESLWSAPSFGSIAASPLLTGSDLLVVGGFDGILRALRQADGAEEWTFGARDHLYASAAEAADGTLIQPSADGTIYALDPSDGEVVWAFDTREPIRSSPAIDGDGNIYVGSGEGTLFVLNPDGTLRWSMRLIEGDRDDLNASPALGPRGVVVAGESGGVFFVPYDYCLRPGFDPRCRRGGEALPAEGVLVLRATQFGALRSETDGAIDANEPLTFTLMVREDGDTTLALIDSASVTVTVSAAVEIATAVSGDRKFITVIPQGSWSDAAGGDLTVTLAGDYLVNLSRRGLHFGTGEHGGEFSTTFHFDVRARSEGPLELPVPAAPGDPAGILELYRLAAPLPTILPSYNQIGFDSIHYLLGFVEGNSERFVAFGIGAKPSGETNTTVVDPASNVRFPLVLTYDAGLLTMANEAGFAVEFNGFPIPFDLFRVAASVTPAGVARESPRINAETRCADITFYGDFLEDLGYCNPTSGLLTVFGGADLRPHGAGVHGAPAGLGNVTFDTADGRARASLAGSSLSAAEHHFGVLLVDAASGEPVPLEYSAQTTIVVGDGGNVTEVSVETGDWAGTARTYLMVDAYPAARGEITAN